MSEDQDKPVDEKPEREPEGPVGGERLAQARREQQISVLEVAKELHLDEPKVRALERNEFDVLGAPVFAKGHLRKYAQLVGVDPDDIFADYYKMTHTAELPPVVIGRSRVSQELSPGPWIAVIIVILVAVTSYWWFAIESEDAQPEGSPEETPQPQQPQQSTDASPSVEQPVIAAPIVEQQQSQPEPEPLADGQTRISLTFSGDCWTEISDATGQRLFFEMGRTGRNVELTGTAPFAVLFGNVENVSVRVDGSGYPIAPSTPGSRTARLTIIKP
jgi:cytoskeleton protein RodZ